jgi:hypothetical protein
VKEEPTFTFAAEATKRPRHATGATQAEASDMALALVDADGWMAPVRVKREAKNQSRPASTTSSCVVPKGACGDEGDDKECTFEQPVVIEAVFVLRPSPSSAPRTKGAGSSSSSSSSRSESTHSRDMRRFRKNLVRGVNDADVDAWAVAAVVRGGERSGRAVIRMGDMVRVLPKESEREQLVRLMRHATIG